MITPLSLVWNPQKKVPERSGRSKYRKTWGRKIKGCTRCKQGAEQFIWQNIMFDGYSLFCFLIKSSFYLSTGWACPHSGQGQVQTARDLDMGRDMNLLGWGHRPGLLQPPTACVCVWESSWRASGQSSRQVGNRRAVKGGFPSLRRGVRVRSGWSWDLGWNKQPQLCHREGRSPGSHSPPHSASTERVKLLHQSLWSH